MNFIIYKMFLTLLIGSIFLFYASSETQLRNNTEELIPQPRIIGGSLPVKPYFYEVTIVDETSPNNYCSGVLITPEWILSSAYCVKGKSIIRVILGNDFTLDGKLVDRVVIHPYFNPLYMQHDIALIKVKDARTAPGITIAILPSLPIQVTEYVGQSAVVSGFGADTSFPTDPIPILRQLTVRIIENQYCQSDGHYMNNYKLCTGGRAVCLGDEGGPLVIGNTVVGIVSASLNLLKCETQTSTTYTRVNFYRNWIDTMIRTYG